MESYFRTDGAACGRLISIAADDNLSSGYNPNRPTATNQLRKSVAIEFPAMPDEINVKRTALYEEVAHVWIPDGIHVYTGVNPLHLDFSFRLHHADRTYCSRGPYTLLDIAARLHAMLLPIRLNTTNDKDYNAYVGQISAGYGMRNSESDVERKAQEGAAKYTSIVSRSMAKPTVCQLELMNTGEQRPGILCRGYLKDVAVKFIGPYLRGPGNIYNLPTAAEYSFTFVHVPGYSNTLTSFGAEGGLQYHAFAHTVRDKFYNTRDLVTGVSSYQGIEDLPDPANQNASNTLQLQTDATPAERVEAVNEPITFAPGAFGPREVGAPLPEGTTFTPPAVLGAGPTNSPSSAETGRSGPYIEWGADADFFR